MKAIIITIGYELLIGQVVDTNTATIARQLSAAGFTIVKKLSIGDEAEIIQQTLSQVITEAEVIVFTGGLGPTNDDVTKQCLADFFGLPLELHNATLAHLQQMFAARARNLLPANRNQALVPKGATVLFNALGTAPGLYIQNKGCHLFALPGVPFEMEALLTGQVIPILKQQFNLPARLQQTLLLGGIAESALAHTLINFEASLPKEASLAYLPAAGTIRLRLSAPASSISHTQFNGLVSTLINQVQPWLIARADVTMAEAFAQLLLSNSLTISVAESCTGGYLAHLLSAIPGASKYFQGSVTAYTFRQKQALLSVNKNVLSTHGAVNATVAQAMAAGVAALMQTPVSIATTGVLGPGADEYGVPTGTVFISVAYNGNTFVKQLSYNKNRAQNIVYASNAALLFCFTTLTTQLSHNIQNS